MRGGRGRILERDGLRERQVLRQLADDLFGRERGGFELGDLRERVVERGVAVALAGVGRVEELLLRGERGLQALLLVVGSEPGVESHGGQKQGDEEYDEVKCAAGHRSAVMGNWESVKSGFDRLRVAWRHHLA